MGYVVNEDVFFSGPERTQHTATGKSLRLHLILDCILESFKAAQQPGALSNTKIRLGRVEKVVNLYVPLQFIIGDVEGGDQLTSRYHYRLKNCNRMCRTCDVSTANCNRWDICCNRIKLATVRDLYERQDLPGLKDICQRHTYNAFYDIDCGKDPYGIFSMVHTEGLHALEVGLMKYMMEVLMADLPKAQHATLDSLVKKLNRFPNQHGYKGFPRCIWLDGVTTLAKLTGDHRVGKMFAVLLVALTEDGEKFFTQHLGSVTWRRMVYCFEQMLCYWAWLKQDHYWMTDDIAACEEATKSIRIMARQLQVLWPRRKGLKWALTKLHEMFHVPLDIHRNGKHYNVHSGPQEHNHMSLKAAALKTQRQKHKLDLQTGERIVDRLILQRAFDRVRQTAYNMDQELLSSNTLENTDSIPSTGIIQNSTKGVVHITQPRPSIQNPKPLKTSHIKWKLSRKKELTDNILSQQYVLSFLIEKLFPEYRKLVCSEAGIYSFSLTFRCFTEYQRNGIVYRCHPKYRGDRPYYDWCYVMWDNDDGTVYQLIGRIHLFIETPSGELKAVVQSMDKKTEEAFSVFGTYWYLEHTGSQKNRKPMFHLVDVECLGDHAMIIPYNNDGTKFIHIHDRSDWADCFTTSPLPVELHLTN